MRRKIASILIYTIIFGWIGMTGQPVRAEEILKIKQDKISVGQDHTVVIKEDGTVWSWGSNGSGALGYGYGNSSRTPVQAVGLDNIVSISAGSSHTVALKEDGTVWTWGYNNSGQLGNGTSGANSYSYVPIQVKGLSNVVAISANAAHTVVLKKDGTVWGWGDGFLIGDGTNHSSNIPIQVKGLSNVVSVSAGNSHTLALKKDGTVWAWGSNGFGSLGDGTIESNYVPVQVKELNKIVEISAGSNHNIALKEDGTIWAWGYNFYGQIGNRTNEDVNIPVQIKELDKVVSVSAGSSHTVVLKNDGTVWTWGYKGSNSLGYKTDDHRNFPSKVEGLKNIVAISDSFINTFAIDEDGTLWSWGDNRYGQLGDGDLRYYGNLPIQVSIVSAKSSISKKDSKTDYLYDTEDPAASIILPHENISKITNKETAVQAVVDTAKELTKEQKSSPTGVDLVTLFVEEALSQASSTKVEGNDIEINSKTITPLQTIATQTKTEMDKALLGQGITTGREIPTAIKLKTDSTKDLKITLDKSILTTKADKITVESPNISVKIDTNEIKEDIKNEPLIITITEGETIALEENYELASTGEIQISATVKKTYAVNFNRAVKENITVSLPKIEGDVKYQAVIKSDGTVVGGKYNPAKNTIDVKIKESGKYTVKENKKDFTDIKNKSKEMQEAIKVLASKGIIDGNTATTFNPDGPISRAEISALIIKTLSKVDKTAEVGFKDITSKDWYYNIAGSSKKYGIINGYDDNTFRGKNQIKKDQIIAVAARTLKTEMKYKDPKDTIVYLNSYKDNTKIASWAKADISLATRENLVLKRVDGNFLGDDYMTRGDAAIIIKRLFDRIW